MAKRSYDEIENINDVDGPMSSTSIHGAVVTLSLVKKGRKAMFFDGLLADESSQIRLVGFQGMQQRKLNDFHQWNVAVALENCQVKPARQGEGYEVMLKTSTIIKESPKKLDVASLMADVATASKTVTHSSLEILDVFQKVTVNIKVVELKDETQVGGRVKRGVSVADESGTARVSVWEGNVNAMEKYQSYCLKNFMVREYQSTRYLTMVFCFALVSLNSPHTFQRLSCFLYRFCPAVASKESFRAFHPLFLSLYGPSLYLSSASPLPHTPRPPAFHRLILNTAAPLSF